MRLTDILQPEFVKVPLEATDKKAAIGEMVDLLAHGGKIKEPSLVLAGVLEREATRTTGVGHGLAIPHCKCAGIGKLMMAIGKPASPIDFQAIDGRPVFVIALLISPPDQTGNHIQALARLSRLMTNEAFRSTIKAAKTSEEVYEAIVAQENATPASAG